MKLPAYPSYKPSGIGWLGEVPGHWKTDRYSRHFQSSMGQTILKEELIDDGEVPVYSATESGAVFGYVDDPAVELIEGDLVIPARGASIGFPLLVKHHATCTQTTIYSKLTGRANVHSPFVFYYMVGFRSVLFYYDRTAIPQITVEQVSSNPLLIPPFSEQCAIADYLDRETLKLDTLMAKKRELIEKLKEKRTALISRTVTRGLDPSTKLKPSGIEWLGDIPAHWEVKRLKHIVRKIEQGWSPECSNAEASLEDWGVVKAGCCNGGRFNSAENKALPPDLDVPVNLEIKAGDILMSRASGSEELIGSTALVPIGTRHRLLLSDKTYCLRYNLEAVAPGLLVLLLQSQIGRMQIQSVISGALGLAKNIAQSDVKDFVLPLPPLPEQRAIADYLDRETAKLDRMVEKVEAAVAKLQEYRTALITAAVTGKIDVRNAAKSV